MSKNKVEETKNEETKVETKEETKVEVKVEVKEDSKIDPKSETVKSDSEPKEECLKGRCYDNTKSQLLVSPLVKDEKIVAYACRIMEDFNVAKQEFDAGGFLVVDKEGSRAGLSSEEFEKSNVTWDCSVVLKTQLNGGPA